MTPGRARTKGSANAEKLCGFTVPSNSRCTNGTAVAPSPTAEATRLTDQTVRCYAKGSGTVPTAWSAPLLMAALPRKTGACPDGHYSVGSTPSGTAREGLVDPGHVHVGQVEVACPGIFRTVLRVGGLGDRESRRPPRQERQRDLTRCRVVLGGNLLQHEPLASPAVESSHVQKDCSRQRPRPAFHTRAAPGARCRVRASGRGPGCMPAGPARRSHVLLPGRARRSCSRPRRGSCPRAPVARRRRPCPPGGVRRASAGDSSQAGRCPAG